MLARVKPQARFAQRHEGMIRPGKPGTAPWRGIKPLEGKPWTWLRDETSLQSWWRSKPSRTCETSRTERNLGSENLGMSGRCRWCRDEGQQPQGRRSSALGWPRGCLDERGAGRRSSTLWRRRKAHGRMKPRMKVCGGRRTERDRRARPKGRGRGGSEGTQHLRDPVA